MMRTGTRQIAVVLLLTFPPQIQSLWGDDRLNESSVWIHDKVSQFDTRSYFDLPKESSFLLFVCHAKDEESLLRFSLPYQMFDSLIELHIFNFIFTSELDPSL